MGTDYMEYLIGLLAEVEAAFEGRDGEDTLRNEVGAERQRLEARVASRREPQTFAAQHAKYIKECAR